MKYLKLFLLPLLIFSCSENRNINQFEFALGKKNSETLTYLVGDFEDSFLKKEYPNLNTKNAYEQFLKDLRVDKEIN